MISSASSVRTRFAPSPTGDLHLGGVWTALASWVVARRAGGAFVVRVEDLDPPRVVPGVAARILEDLAWLGFEWDEGPDVGGPFGPYVQSARTDRYEAALAALERAGLTYPCDCSRAEIARVASAPHPGEELVYPGTCREAGGRPLRRSAAIRLRVPRQASTRTTNAVVHDGALGPLAQDLSRDVGDFVLRRGDGAFAYQLAVTVDDAEMAITDVFRGSDLAPSAPRQAYVMRLLGYEPPRYTHLPLVVDTDGERLAKRVGAASLRALRGAGVAAETIVGILAHGLGLAPNDEARSPRDLLVRDPNGRFFGPNWPALAERGPFRVPQCWSRQAP